MITILLLLASASNISFPIAEEGLCYDGIQELLKYYPNAKIAYNPYPNQGHVWIITEDDPIDSYYGPRSGPFWENPTYLFSNMTKLDEKITELTGYKECTSF
jgi:hypothetical protein